MTDRHIQFTQTAHEHVRRERVWWLENRTHTELFAAEFDEALRILRVLPGAGTSYRHPGVPGLRRIYLPKVACHIYYTFDEHDVTVRAFWGARRGHGPSVVPR